MHFQYRLLPNSSIRYVPMKRNLTLMMGGVGVLEMVGIFLNA